MVGRREVALFARESYLVMYAFLVLAEVRRPVCCVVTLVTLMLLNLDVVNDEILIFLDPRGFLHCILITMPFVWQPKIVSFLRFDLHWLHSFLLGLQVVRILVGKMVWDRLGRNVMGDLGNIV